MVQREEMYFEPRCVGSDLRIRWYGEQYSAPELERHYEETVYIRDSGKELMVYSMEADCWDEKAKIKATFSLICRIQKHSTGFRYGRKNPVGGLKMKYKISNAYAVINGEEIQVGVALGQEDLPEARLQQDMLPIQNMNRD